MCIVYCPCVVHVPRRCRMLPVSTFRAAYEKTVGLSYRMDVTFFLSRIGLFYMDHDLITRNVEKAKG